MTGAILAGGKGTRIGANKAFLEIGGRPLIEAVLEKVKGIFDELFIVANDPHSYEYLKMEVFPDLIPDKSSLGGIYTALNKASFPQVFCIACDMPFIEPAFTRYMMEGASNYEVVIPRSPDGLEPLHAIYSKSCLPCVERLLDVGDLKILHLFPEVRVKTLESEEIEPFDPHGMLFFNINNPEDLERAREHWQMLEKKAIYQDIRGQ